jgi:hypothetical protein
MKFGFLILIAFPSNAQINSRKMERGREIEKQDIEPSKEKPKMLDCFKINWICSSFGEPAFEYLFGIEESKM